MPVYTSVTSVPRFCHQLKVRVRRGVELVRLIEQADAGVRHILAAGERATELRVGERGAGGEALHVARARVRVGDQRLPVVGVLLPQLEGQVVRVVLALVLEIDRGREPRGPTVRRRRPAAE